MKQYPKRDVKRLIKFIEDLKALRPRDNYLVSITKLSNLLNKVGFSGPVYKPGSKRQFSHELLKEYVGCFDGAFLMTEAHGKKDQIHYRNLQHYCLGPIEYVIDRIGREGLTLEEDENYE
jgi:hypothetical protein